MYSCILASVAYSSTGRVILTYLLKYEILHTRRPDTVAHFVATHSFCFFCFFCSLKGTRRTKYMKS